MPKTRTQSSPSTLTHARQQAILRKHLNAFVKAQAKANEALQAINEIASLESEGNPLVYRLIGTEAVFNYATPCSVLFTASALEAEAEKFNDLLTEAQQILYASGYWASND